MAMTLSETPRLPQQEYHDLRNAKGAATALNRYAEKIPPERIQELRQIVRDFLGKDFTEEDLRHLEEADLENHPGFLDVMKEIAHGVSNYSAFARECESTLCPQCTSYMPKAWKVDRQTELDKIVCAD